MILNTVQVCMILNGISLFVVCFLSCQPGQSNMCVEDNLKISFFFFFLGGGGGANISFRIHQGEE